MLLKNSISLTFAFEELLTWSFPKNKIVIDSCSSFEIADSKNVSSYDCNYHYDSLKKLNDYENVESFTNKVENFVGKSKNNSNNTEMDDLVLLFNDDGKDTFDGIVGLEVEEEEDGDG